MARRIDAETMILWDREYARWIEAYNRDRAARIVRRAAKRNEALAEVTRHLLTNIAVIRMFVERDIVCGANCLLDCCPDD